MKVCTAAEMANFDRLCIDERGIPGLLLMEQAGYLTARVARELFCGQAPSRVFVLCGGGNNGGDGFVIARHLLKWGFEVDAACLKPLESLSEDAAINAAYFSQLSNRPVLDFDDQAWTGLLDRAGLVVDALFGTGLSGALRGKGKEVVDRINDRANAKTVIAVDIPSGLSADDAAVSGSSVNATCTVTMGLPKRGFFCVNAREKLGSLYVADIGFPRNELSSVGGDCPVEVLLAGDAAGRLPPRMAGGHKGDFGKVAIVAGSRGMAGAACLCARSALRAGAGLVYLAVPECVRAEAAAAIPEVITLGLPDRDGAIAPSCLPLLKPCVDSCDALLIGPGIGRSALVVETVRAILEACSQPLVLDADALFALPSGFSFENRIVIMTPHPGEAARLCAVGTGDINSRRGFWVTKMAADRNSVCILKGPFTLSADPAGRMFINPTGNCGMATAGSGDVLAGIAAGLLPRMQDRPLDCAALAVYLHGFAGDLAMESHGEQSMVAGDIIEHLGAAFVALENVTPAGPDDPYPAVLPCDRLGIVR